MLYPLSYGSHASCSILAPFFDRATKWPRDEHMVLGPSSSDRQEAASGQVITDARLVAAIVDRLTFNAHIIETGSESYRLKSTQARRAKKSSGTCWRRALISARLQREKSYLPPLHST